MTEAEVRTVNTFLTSDMGGYGGNSDQYSPRELCALTSVSARGSYAYYYYNAVSNKPIPDAFWKLKNLTSLDLSSRGLSSLSPLISNLKKLQTLYLDGNAITSLPGSFSGLTELRTLSYTSNGLTVLPELITDLPNLTSLSLAYNQLSGLPNSIGNLTKLSSLTLNNNKLISLPASIGLLSVSSMDLSVNDLGSLPS